MRDRPPTAIRVGRPPVDRPLLIYDGECGFCQFWAYRFLRISSNRLDIGKFQTVASLFPEIEYSRFQRAVHFIDCQGHVCQGAEATFAALAVRPLWAWLLWLYRNIPGTPWLSELLYRWVARHRTEISSLCRWSV